MDSLQYLHVFAILLLSGDRFWATKGDEVLMAGPSCQLRQYNFTAEMKTGQGMSCRRFVTTVGCMGVCETFEVRK